MPMCVRLCANSRVSMWCDVYECTCAKNESRRGQTHLPRPKKHERLWPRLAARNPRQVRDEAKGQVAVLRAVIQLQETTRERDVARGDGTSRPVECISAQGDGLGTSTCSAVPQRLCMKVVTMSPYSSAPVTASHHSFAPMLLEQWFNSASFICRPSLPPANPSASSSTGNAGAPRTIPAPGIRVNRRDLSAQLQVPRLAENSQQDVPFERPVGRLGLRRLDDALGTEMLLEEPAKCTCGRLRERE